MEIENIRTLADAQQYFTEHTPNPIRKWYGLKCPRCGKLFFNSMFATWFGYDLHYMDHIIDEFNVH